MNIPLTEYWQLLSRYLLPLRRRVVVLASLLLTSITLDLIGPQIIRYFLDTVTTGGAMQQTLLAAVAFIGAEVLQRVIMVSNTYISEGIAWRATNTLRADLALHCLKLDLSFHNARTPGELIERVDGDVTALANFFSNFVVRVLGNALLLLGALIMFAREDWRLGLGMAIFSLIALLLLIRLRNIATPHWEKQRQISAEFYGFLGERLAGIEDLRANGAVGYTMNRFYGLLQRWLPITRRAGLYGITMWWASLLLFTFGTVLAFGISAWLYQGGVFTIGTVYLIFWYAEMIRHPIEQIRFQLDDLQKASASIVRVRQLFAERSKLTPQPDSLSVDTVWFGGSPPHSSPDCVGVNFDKVTFGYNETQPVLKDVSFSLAPGQVLGLLGRTGSGKSTLARLLLRLYDPQHGEIVLTDTATARMPIMGVPLAHLRQSVGLVTQEVQLFHASVRDNLTFFDRAITDARIQAELQELGLWQWVASLPDGLNTVFQSRGTGLSAGEAQLLAFARVFLRDPQLVILDEASSRLDPVTEQLIERAVTRLLHNRTGIIIAHRLATVERADHILILEDGCVLEHGPRVALAQNSRSRFHQLLKAGLGEVLV